MLKFYKIQFYLGNSESYIVKKVFNSPWLLITLLFTVNISYALHSLCEINDRLIAI